MTTAADAGRRNVASMRNSERQPMASPKVTEDVFLHRFPEKKRKATGQHDGEGSCFSWGEGSLMFPAVGTS